MNKEILITYETGNDAFQGDFEIMEAIQKSIIKFFENGQAKIKDINGNTVGKIEEVTKND